MAIRQNGKPYRVGPNPGASAPPGLRQCWRQNFSLLPGSVLSVFCQRSASVVELLMGNWDGFDMQAELRPGFVPAACIAKVPGLPLGPVQDFDAEALATT